MLAVHINEGASLDFFLCIFFFFRSCIFALANTCTLCYCAFLAKNAIYHGKKAFEQIPHRWRFSRRNTTRKVYDIMKIVCKILFSLFCETVMTGYFVILYIADSSIDHVSQNDCHFYIFMQRFTALIQYYNRPPFKIHKPALVDTTKWTKTMDSNTNFNKLDLFIIKYTWLQTAIISSIKSIVYYVFYYLKYIIKQFIIDL